jgi:hypothetical protein
MSDTRGRKKVPLRRTIVRSVLIAAYVGLMVLVFILGKGHTLLVDNKDVEGMPNVVAFDDVVVGVDRQETTELTSGDRDMFKVTGQRHRVTMEIMGQPEKVVKDIVLPLGQDMILVSLPKLAAGIEPYLEPFKPLETVTPSRDSETFTITGSEAIAPDPNAAPPAAPTSP